MKEVTLRAPDLMLLVGTRVALGIGVGLLVATRLEERARKSAGVALLLVGALTTLPILLNVRAGAARAAGSERAGEAVGSGSELRGGDVGVE
jgi:hypothetical protein